MRRAHHIALLVFPSVAALIIFLIMSGAGDWRCLNCNVILISIDTLRADALGVYGNPRNTTPNLDRLAGQGILFTTVYSHAPTTAPSQMSILTSRYPEEHRVCDVEDTGPLCEVPLGEDLPTLPEVIRANGYYTAGFTGNGAVRRELGFGRGFYEFNYDAFEGFLNAEGPFFINSKEPFPALLEAAQGRPFFLFLHTYKTHDPYTPAEDSVQALCGEYSGQVIDSFEKLYERTIQELRHHPGSAFSREFFEGMGVGSPEDSARAGDIIAITSKGYTEEAALELAAFLQRLKEEDAIVLDRSMERAYGPEGKELFLYPGNARRTLTYDASTFTERDVDYLRCLYDAEVFEMDESIGVLRSQLDRAGLSDKTIIIFTSDHGEEFLEHGGFLHDDLFNEALLVPLIMYNPHSARQGTRIPTRVGLVDIFPTVIDMFGISADLPLRGRSLVPLMDNEEREALPVYGQIYGGHPMAGRMIVDSVGNVTYKLITDWNRPITLFNLDDDPGEQKDLSSEEQNISDILRQKLLNHTEESSRWRASKLRKWGFSVKNPVEEEVLDRLKSLGYIG